MEIKKFLNLIKLAHKNGADLIKMQTYQPEDIVINSKKKFIESKVDCGKINIYGIYM